jgi:hypothetical protein
MPEVPTITVGRLRQELKMFDDDTELSFGGLEFHRVKSRGDNLVQIEFNELVYLDASGRVVVQNPEQ